MWFTQINYQRRNIDNMFKQIIEELNRVKKLMNITESEKQIYSVIFGDDTVNNFEDQEIEKIYNLSDSNINIKKLISRLKKQDPRPEVDHLFFSTGKNDNFEDFEKVPMLCDLIKVKFPNAKFNIIKSIVNPSEFEDFESDLKENERNANIFYDEFKKCGFDVIGDYRVLDVEKSGIERKVKTLKDNILNKIIKNVSDFEIETKPKEIKNDDITGEDKSDFDTIYEFLSRFEEMVKSKNEYKKNMSSGFAPDIEQIQIALKFIDEINSDLEITGKIDSDTENAILDFQIKNKLDKSGIADTETL